jgi:hypothetical protein
MSIGSFVNEGSFPQGPIYGMVIKSTYHLASLYLQEPMVSE